MKTKTINIYEFSELSEEAKENAIEEWRNTNYGNEFFWQREVEASLDKFCSIFSIDYRLIDYEEPYRNDYKVNLDDNILTLSGQRLATYIWNNFRNDLFKGKYYSVLKVDRLNKRINHKRIRSEQLRNGNYFNAYYSAIKLDNCCVLTGVCYDDDILKPIYEFLDHPKDNIDFETLINDCFYSLCHSVSSEIEYQNTDEYITEEIEANGYEFDEDGNMI